MRCACFRRAQGADAGGISTRHRPLERPGCICPAGRGGRAGPASLGGQHSAPLTLRRAVPKDDTHLLHAVRMALRISFARQTTGRSCRCPGATRTPAVADVAVGVPSPEAGAFLIGHSAGQGAGREHPALAQQAARYCTAEQVPVLWSFAAKNRPADPRGPGEFLQGDTARTQSRGGALPPEAENGRGIGRQTAGLPRTTVWWVKASTWRARSSWLRPGMVLRDMAGRKQLLDRNVGKPSTHW